MTNLLVGILIGLILGLAAAYTIDCLIHAMSPTWRAEP